MIIYLIITGKKVLMMSPIEKKMKLAITAKITKSIQKVLDSADLKDLSEEQVEFIAKSYYIDSLKEEFGKEIKKTKLNPEELIEQWLSGFTSVHTVRSFRKNLSFFLSWLNCKSIIDVDPLTVDKYIAFINTDKTLSNNTRRQRIAACSSFFSDLERWGVIDKNPFQRAKGVPKKTLLTKSYDSIPTNEELDHIERFALIQIKKASDGGRGTNKKLAGGIFALCTLKILRMYGLRVGALKTLKIDRNGNFKAFSKGKEVYGKFNEDILNLLDSYGLSRREPFRDYSEAAFSMWLWRAQKSDELAGMFKTKFSPHSIRHRFSIDFYKRTKDVHELSRRLGHSSLLVTTSYLSGLVK